MDAAAVQPCDRTHARTQGRRGEEELHNAAKHGQRILLSLTINDGVVEVAGEAELKERLESLSLVFRLEFVAVHVRRGEVGCDAVSIKPVRVGVRHSLGHWLVCDGGDVVVVHDVDVAGVSLQESARHGK